jgi:hypothetical protein
MAETPERRQNDLSAFERHAQTGIAVLLVMLLGWVGLTTQSTQVKVAQLTVEVNHLKNALAIPEPRLDDLTRRIDILEQHILTEDLDHRGRHN